MNINMKAFQKIIENGEKIMGRPLSDNEKKLLALGFLHGEQEGWEKGNKEGIRQGIRQGKLQATIQTEKEKLVQSLIDLKRSVNHASVNVERLRKY